MANNNKTEGWVCPKCGRVYAPWVDKCQYCGNVTNTYTWPTCPHSWWCTHPYYSNTITTDSVTLNSTNTGAVTTTDTTLNNEITC